jgi:peptide/nickel transport system permease protein
LAAAPLSFFVCLSATIVALTIGALLGGLGGYRGGAIDRVLSAITDSLTALPALLLALLIMAIVGPSAANIAIAVGIASAPSVARVVRGTVLSIRQKEFIEASRMLGASHGAVFARHVLPNCITPLTVLATNLASQALLIESALSFLGLGAPPPTATWGGLLADSRQFIASAPWLGIFPGLALSASVLALNFLGDWLRQRFDKRLRR